MHRILGGMPQRSIRIDVIKGALVLLMIIYHACYIAVMFGLSTIDLYHGFWWLFPRFIAASFVTVSGWNLAGKRLRGGTFADSAGRAARLGLVALVISAVTWPVFGTGFVFFGIIHLLALSSILAYPLLGRPALALALGAACLAGGWVLGPMRFAWPWLAWLGLRPTTLYPADYLPLVPWFGFVAFGAAAHDISAKANRVGPELSPGLSLKPAVPIRAVAALGKHSLVVYLAHLPLLYGLGWAIHALIQRR